MRGKHASRLVQKMMCAFPAPRNQYFISIYMNDVTLTLSLAFDRRGSCNKTEAPGSCIGSSSQPKLPLIGNVGDKLRFGSTWCNTPWQGVQKDPKQHGSFTNSFIGPHQPPPTGGDRIGEGPRISQAYLFQTVRQKV